MWIFKWLCYPPSLPLAMHKCFHSWKASGSDIQKPTDICVTTSLCSDLGTESFQIMVSQHGKIGLQVFPRYQKLWVLKAKLWRRLFTRCMLCMFYIFCVIWYTELNGTRNGALMGVMLWWCSDWAGHFPMLQEFCPVTFASQVSKICVIVYNFGIKQEGKFSFKLGKKILLPWVYSFFSGI